MNTSDTPRETDDQSPPPEVAPAIGEPAETPTVETAPAGQEQAPRPPEPPQQPIDEGLPELEPLTPELVEEEALRGDFMLRWAVVLLALMLGCTVIKNSATLVRIRSGEYIASHGWLPPATDVFSSTATGQPWINIAWMGDVLQAGLYHLGGDNALSLACGLLAAVSFWLLNRTTRPGISTWWGSVCAALGLLAVFPLLNIGPDVFTVLGLALVMTALAYLESNPASRVIWLIPVVLLVWAQLDEQIFLGVVLVAAYAIGHTIDVRTDDANDMIPPGRMWACAGLCLVAVMVHPYLYETLLSAIRLHTEVYPAHAEYGALGQDFQARWLPLTDPGFWTRLSVPSVAALLMAAVALVAMLLNAGRLRWSHAVAWLVVNGLAVAAGRNLFAAAIVNVVLAAINGQDWYRSSFRQTYSVETSELIFSRGGRAVTVLALFALGYLGTSGRLMGPDVRRVGIGFDPQLNAVVESFQDVLKDSLDDRPFNFRVEQGDVLIWIGQRPFIDSRLDLYTHSDPNLVDLHLKIRPALLPPDANHPERGQTDVWEQAFEKYEVTHVLPRLSGEQPDYETLLQLMIDPRWRLAKLGAATAALYDYQASGDVLGYLADHQGADFIQLFRNVPENQVLVGQPVWPEEVTLYDELLRTSRQPVSNEIQLARHYSVLLQTFSTSLSSDQLLALAQLVVRHAWRGLAEQPNSVEGYLALTDAYRFLLNFHQLIQQSGGIPGSELLQASHDAQLLQSALQNCVACRPDEKNLRFALAEYFRGQQKIEQALEQYHEYERLNGDLSPLKKDDAGYTDALEQYQQIVSDLQTAVDEKRQKINEEQAAGTPTVQIAVQAVRNGMTVDALRVLESDATTVAQDPSAQLLMAQLLLDVGRGEEAVTRLEQMETGIRESVPALLSDWEGMTAMANLTLGNFERAADLWGRKARDLTDAELRRLLGFASDAGTDPGISMTPLTYAPAFIQDIRPLMQAYMLGNLLLRFSSNWDDALLQEGLVQLQQGKIDEATKTLESILDYDPETEYRPLIAFYLTVATGEPHEFMPPSDEIPITGDMFAPDDAGDGETESPAPDSPSQPPAPPESQRADEPSP